MHPNSFLLRFLSLLLMKLLIWITLSLRSPPPPVSRNRLAQEPPPGSAVELSRHFFYRRIGFFMVVGESCIDRRRRARELVNTTSAGEAGQRRWKGGQGRWKI